VGGALPLLVLGDLCAFPTFAQEVAPEDWQALKTCKWIFAATICVCWYNFLPLSQEKTLSQSVFPMSLTSCDYMRHGSVWLGFLTRKQIWSCVQLCEKTFLSRLTCLIFCNHAKSFLVFGDYLHIKCAVHITL
jgi:hypothetical protein